jgi:glycosyltransferase involved in cell wall biosynthesis
LNILILHTYYQQKGGEDTAFQTEYHLLNQMEKAQVLTWQNETGWKGLLQFLFYPWNFVAGKKLNRHIQKWHPDIIHIHNWHFAMGPIAIRLAKRKNIPVILTLHNYRLLCPSGTLFHKSALFTDSIHASFPWTAVAKKVYRNSAIETFWLGFVTWLHKKMGTWQSVDKYFVLTDFSKSLFVHSSLGLPAEKFEVKPNSVPPTEFQNRERKGGFLFVGRLSEEKGLEVLLKAFRNSNWSLAIAGEGPLKNLVCQACNESSNLKYLGSLDSTGIRSAMNRYEALIFPSTWFEGMPLTILEAFASGMPVIASRLGAMAEMIRHGFNGFHFEPGNIGDLEVKLNEWQNLSSAQKEEISQNAYATYIGNYTPEKNLCHLLEIYHLALK